MIKPRRESKKQFWARVKREGLRKEAQSFEAYLRAEGWSKREIQRGLVHAFQPADGSRTVAWETPDSWRCGRLDAKKTLDSQERFELDLQWVHSNPDRPVKEAPTPGARRLLQFAKERPHDFLKLYAKHLPSITERQQEKLEARREKVAERRQAARQKEAHRRAEAEQRKQERLERKQAKKREQERLEAEKARKQEQTRLE